MPNKPLIIITGASHGIGRALAFKFSQQDYPCLLISRNMESFPELNHEKNIYKKLDVTDFSALQSAIKEAEERFGEAECIINNAGSLTVGEFRDIDIEKTHYEMDVLIKGVVNGIKCVLPAMAARKSGTIINISSIGDRKPYPQAVMYHAAKHAVRSMAESLQMAEAKNNVRIMNIAPGLIKTNIHENMGISFEEYCERLGNPTFIQAEELADIILFCWNLPQRICIRDLVVMPTDCGI
ncbi:SDR family oxidoreductase [Legionella waltersii]|uniref:Short chain dehydrogenase/reductase family oxidoreductase n=1 Tax=Legionella waltersii TaxID=66969 RepID=A0A0W1A4P4_9GAMM|nr:SDR family oxidoreductase [Legionella waltersii]KTD76309.1 short chain dehydrogenase/reductase family oxidoreductase [Legionella waltersii]SNV13612.1 short chain dehydrogenase/reductase family oxidoreductase [Legionella waltersii]